MLDRIFFLYVNLVWFGLDFELTNLHSISFLVICFTKRNYIDSINSSYCCGMNSFFFHKNMTSKLLDWLMCRENFYKLIQLKLFAFCCYWQWLVFTEFYRVVPTGTALEKNGRDRSLLALCSLLFLFIFFLFFFFGRLSIRPFCLPFPCSAFFVWRDTFFIIWFLVTSGCAVSFDNRFCVHHSYCDRSWSFFFYLLCSTWLDVFVMDFHYFFFLVLVLYLPELPSNSDRHWQFKNKKERCGLDFYSVFMPYTELLCVFLKSFTGIYSSFTGFHWVWLEFPGFLSSLNALILGHTLFLKGFIGIHLGFYWILMEFYGFYWTLLVFF